jgi:hypothetical protein
VLGRIGFRAFIIVLLMLAALGALAVNGLQVLAHQNTIIEELGVRDRVAIDAENAFSTPVADFSSAFSAVMAGALPPTVTAPRMLRNAQEISQGFQALDALLGSRLDPVMIGGARDMAARLIPLGEKVRDAFARRERGAYTELQEEWLDVQVAFNRVISSVRDLVRADQKASLDRARDQAEAGQRTTLIAGGAGLVGVLLTWLVLVQLLSLIHI